MGAKRYYVTEKKEIAKDCFEAPYDVLVESEDGNLLKRGIEYLSGQELCSLSLWDLKRPTGKLNRAGQRLWESFDTIYAENYADAKKIMQYFYPDQELQLARVRRGYVFRLE